MIVLGSLLVAVLEGLTRGAVSQIGANARFKNQQGYLATLRLREQELLVAEQRAQQEISRANSIELEAVRGFVTLEKQRVLARERRDAENSPFTYDLARTREIVEEKTGPGRPVLVLAPFYNEGPRGPLNQFDVALRRTWESLPWAGDLERVAGLVERPLRHSDIDVLLIQQTLANLPVVLVHGDIQAGRRVWTSLIAWGLTPADPDAVFKVNLPRLHSPDPKSSTADEALAFQDELARVCGTVAGVLGDWYHLHHSGRRPRVHLSVEDPEIRRSLGAALAAAYEAEGPRGALGSLPARLGQARVLAESGLRDAAVAIVGEVIRSAGADPAVRREIDEIGELLRSTGGDSRVLDLRQASDRQHAELEADFWIR